MGTSGDMETSTREPDRVPGEALGAFLRARRKERGMTLRELAERLRIRPDYLRALEEERWGDLPGGLFVRGYLRAYGLELGISLEEICARHQGIEEAKVSAPPKPERLVSTALFAPKRNRASLVSVIVVGVFLASIAWWFRGEITEDPLRVQVETLRQQGPTESERRGRLPDGGQADDSRGTEETGTGSSVGLAQTATAAVDAGSAGVPLLVERTVEVVAREMAWFSATVDDRREREFLLQAGDRVALEGRVFVLRLGNAGGLDVSVDGASLGSFGPRGEVLTLRIPGGT